MIRSITLVLFLIGQGYVLLAQKDYRPGYIITLKKDTLSGYLRYVAGNSRFEECSFRATLDGNTVTYTPDKLIGYRFKNDSYYATKSVTREGNDDSQLYFAEVLVSGKANLLRVFESFYLEDSSQKIYELKKVVTEIHNDQGRFRKTDNLYMGILSWQFADCPTVAKKIKNVRFGELDLTKIFEQYNSFFNTKSVSFKESKPWTQIYIGVGGGGITSVLYDLENLPLAPVINIDQFKKDKGLFFGFNYSFSSPRISERISLNIDLLYQKSSHESIITNPGRYDVVVLNYNSLRIPLGLQYHINDSRLKVKPLLEAGVSYSLNLSSKSYWQYETENSGTVTINRTNNVIPAKANLVKPFVGIGALYDIGRMRAVIRGHYLYGASKIKNDQFFIKEQNISIMGSILFKL